MQLTLYTDYSLRVLLYLALAGRSATIGEISESYGISRNHLVKVAHNLGKKGYIQTERGRNGGLRLARDPAEIGLGAVVRDMEPNFDIVECFNRSKNRCVIAPRCALRGVLYDAQRAFLDVLDGQTLADVVGDAPKVRRLLGLNAKASMAAAGAP